MTRLPPIVFTAGSNPFFSVNLANITRFSAPWIRPFSVQPSKSNSGHLRSEAVDDAQCPGDTRFALFATDGAGNIAGRPIREDDDGGVNPCSAIATNLPAGRYELRVDGFAQRAILASAPSWTLAMTNSRSILHAAMVCSTTVRNVIAMQLTAPNVG